MKMELRYENAEVVGADYFFRHGRTLDDEEVSSDVPDPFEKFIQTAQLAGAIGRDGHQRAHNLQIETSEQTAAVAAIYKKLAKDAAAKREPADPQRLEKRATDPRVVKVQETVIGSAVVVAELDASGVCVRTYRKTA